MKNISLNIIRLTVALVMVFSVWTTTYAIEDYTPLAPLPGTTKDDCMGTDCKTDLETYLPGLFNWAIGVAAVMAFVVITAGGITYMTADSIAGTSKGKEMITNAIWGLLLVIGAYVILYTINPEILALRLDIPRPTIEARSTGGESDVNPNPIAPAILQARGISCTGTGGKSALETIGKQFIGKTTYNQARRNTFDSSTLYLDCSSYVAQVYRCAGLPSPGNITTDIFSSGAVKVDGKAADFEKSLKPGDLIGWKKGDNLPATPEGHVMIYLGNGQVLDQQLDSVGGVKVRNLSYWKQFITYVK